MTAHQEQQPTTEHDYSFDAFYAQYGDTCGIECDTLQNMWLECVASMPQENSQVYGYHNARHPQQVVWDAMAISDQREADDPNVVVRRRPLILAALYHDVFYDVPLENHGFDSREAFSAYCMQESAPSYGFSQDEINLATGIIMTTKLGTSPRTVEEQIIIEADIHNIAGDYQTSFIDSLKKLAIENLYEKALMRVLHEKGDHFDRTEFTANSIKVLCTYLSYLDQKSPFVRTAKKNIRHLARETAKLEHRKLSEYLTNLNHSAVTKVLSLRAPLSKKD